jgi:hypothetical protein
MAGPNQIEAPLGAKPEMHKKAAGLGELKVTGFSTGLNRKMSNESRGPECNSAPNTYDACCNR